MGVRVKWGTVCYGSSLQSDLYNTVQWKSAECLICKEMFSSVVINFSQVALSVATILPRSPHHFTSVHPISITSLQFFDVEIIPP